jgi:hypothetical protein
MLWSGFESSSTTKFISKLNEDTMSVSKALFTESDIIIDVEKAPESSVEAQNFTSFNFSEILLPTASADDFILSPIWNPLDTEITDQVDNDPEFQDFIDNHICDYVHILFSDSVSLAEDTASPSQEEELMEADIIQPMIDEFNIAFALNEEKKTAEAAAEAAVALEAEIEQMIDEYHIAFALNGERKAAFEAESIEQINQMINEYNIALALNEEKKAALEAESIEQWINEYNIAFALNEERKAAEAAALEDTASRFQEEELMDADIIEQMINDPHIQEFIDNDVSNLLFCYCYGQTDVIDETGYVADDSEDEPEPFTNTPAMHSNASYWSLLNADHQWYLDDPSYWSLLNADHQWHLPS